MGKVNNIQALRAYAALAVVIFHSGYIFPNMLQMGKFGVDIFFVISGYIMARICSTDKRFFLRRRLIRILPLYWSMTLLLFVFSLIFPRLLYSTYPDLSNLVKSLLFIPYYREDGLIRPLLYVGWSLNYEMLFYAAISLGLLCYRKRPLLFASGLLISLNIFCRYSSYQDAMRECYGNHVVYEFLFGILAYEAARRCSVWWARQFRLSALCALSLCTVALVLFQGVAHRPLPGDWLLMQLTPMLMVLCADVLAKGGWDIRQRLVIRVGDASYVLYLIHAYILSLYDRVLGRRMPGIQMKHAIGAFPLAALCVVTAIFIHCQIDKPMVTFLSQRFGGVRRRVTLASLHVAPEQLAR